jgi:hypothetical protein
MRSLADAGWEVTSIQPVHGEMSTSSTKAGVKEPNNLDSIVICRLRVGTEASDAPSPQDAADIAVQRLQKLLDAGGAVGAGDVRSVVRGSVLALATAPRAGVSVESLIPVADALANAAIQRVLG